MDVVDRVIEAYEKLWEKPLPEETNIPGFSERDMTNLCHRTVEQLSAKSQTLLELQSPIMVIGDIHGSLLDLLRILRIFRPPPQTRYLFLGDYVDRGDNSTDVMTILMALFLKYPEHVFLLRGNHEFSHINRVYGFYDEITDTYKKATLWAIFQRVFSYLPLAAILDNEIFLVHGGLSPFLKKVQTIREIKLPISNYDGQPLISDLLWSDPTDRFEEFAPNNRGSGVLFGKKAVKDFLTRNHLKFMVRAHQCTTTGVHAFAGTLGMTVFSSSNYSEHLDNRSGAIQFKENGEVKFFSLGDDTEDNTCEKAIMVLVDGRIGLQRSTKSYVRTEPVTLDQSAQVKSLYTVIPIKNCRKTMTLQGEDPIPLLSKREKNSLPSSPRKKVAKGTEDPPTKTKTGKKTKKVKKKKVRAKTKSRVSSTTISDENEIE